MSTALAQPSDLETMWRPLASDEVPRATDLLVRASALLRQAQPNLDARIAAFNRDRTDRTGVDPVLVATVVATIVKRFISNVEGIASQGVGPYHVAYALRSEKEVRGELQVTENDIKALAPVRYRQRVGSIKLRPGMAPVPWGDLGVNMGLGVVASMWYDSLAVGTGAFPVEMPVPIGSEFE